MEVRGVGLWREILSGYGKILKKASKYPYADVHKVAVTQGDGGIDIFIDEENGKYTIIQCKYFLKRLDDGRKNQIRESFKTAVTKNEMDNWILYIPMDLSHEEHSW